MQKIKSRLYNQKRTKAARSALCHAPVKTVLPEQIINNTTQTDMLEKILFDKIQSHINQSKNKEEEFVKKLDKYHVFLQQTRIYVKNNYQWDQVIRYLHYHMPLNILINEFEHGTIESFAGKIAQSGLFEENILTTKQPKHE
ncbi:MAG: hypothetical protein ACQES1_10625 [Bacteroidota bacterium]